MNKKINIVLCINSSDEAKILGEQLLGLDFEAKVFFCNSLEELHECCAKNDDINCFVFEFNCEKFNSRDLVSKLGSSERFQPATFIFVTEKESMSEVFEDENLRVDFIITKPFDRKEYAAQLNAIWKKQSGRIIPENLKVLILDDNPKVMEVLEMHMDLIQHKNFETCSSVEEAKKKLATTDYDLLLLDWDLNDGTCIEIIDMLKANTSSARLRDALTIVITGRDAVEDIMSLMEKNVKDHIIKPFDHREFKDKISYALERHQKRLS